MKRTVVMLHVLTAWLLSTLVLTVSADGHDPGGVAVYRQQLDELHGNVRKLFARADASARNESEPQATLKLREEIMALRRLLHKLDETAGEENLRLLEKRHESNKTLLLISEACGALDFILTSVDNFLDTDDRAFLGLAKDGENLAKAVEKIL